MSTWDYEALLTRLELAGVGHDAARRYAADKYPAAARERGGGRKDLRKVRGRSAEFAATGDRLRAERDELLRSLGGPLVPFSAGSTVGHVVDPNSGCWIWSGAIGMNGYGRLGIKGTRRTAAAHRLYFARSGRWLPAGKDLDHLCRRRYCVNPVHLEPVSRATNARRGARAKLDTADAAAIRADLAAWPGSINAFAIARAAKLGVSKGCVVDVIYGRNWAADPPPDVMLFYELLRARSLPLPASEHRFARPRRWRFDFAWPKHRIALEVEGGIWTRGRHVRGRGYLRDMEKYNAAVSLGWKLLRIPPSGLHASGTIDHLITLGLAQLVGETLEPVRASIG